MKTNTVLSNEEIIDQICSKAFVQKKFSRDSFFYTAQNESDSETKKRAEPFIFYHKLKIFDQSQKKLTKPIQIFCDPDKCEDKKIPADFAMKFRSFISILAEKICDHKTRILKK